MARLGPHGLQPWRRLSGVLRSPAPPSILSDAGGQTIWSRRIQHPNTRAATPVRSARLANESQPKEQAPLQLDAIWGTTVAYALAGAIYARWFRGGSFTNNGTEAAGLSKNFAMYSSATGAPRSTKAGTIRSPCPYDAAARPALQSVNLRLPAILHYASCAPGFPILQGSPVSLR